MGDRRKKRGRKADPKKLGKMVETYLSTIKSIFSIVYARRFAPKEAWRKLGKNGGNSFSR
jgi:hypothetical protein